jgi:Glycosyl hydrolases family 16
MKLKNILIIAIVCLTLIAGLTLSIKNFAKTSFIPSCQNNNLMFCINRIEQFSSDIQPLKKNNVTASQVFNNPLEFKPEPSKPVIVIPNEPQKDEINTDKKPEVVKTQEVVTAPIDTIFKPTVVTKPKSSHSITNTYYPTSQGYWNVFEGFDFSGRMKQIYNNENHEFINNSIILKAKKELTNNPLFSTTIDDQRFYTKTAEYAGAKLMLKDRFQYGHISFQAKIPNISGILPAVWLLNQDANNFTEVDLLEVPGSEKNNVYGVTHYGPNYASLTSDHKKMNIPTLSTQFHQYDMYKTSEKISVFIDGALLYEKNVSNAPKYNGINGLDQPLQLIINLNIGDSWAGPINDAQLPVSMTIKDMMIEEYSY